MKNFLILNEAASGDHDSTRTHPQFMTPSSQVRTARTKSSTWKKLLSCEDCPEHEVDKMYEIEDNRLLKYVSVSQQQ